MSEREAWVSCVVDVNVRFFFVLLLVPFVEVGTMYEQRGEWASAFQEYQVTIIQIITNRSYDHRCMSSRFFFFKF